MGPIGTKRSTRKRLDELHRAVMELDSIVDEMSDALRSAYLPYVAESGRLTPKIEWALQRYKWYAMKVCGVRSGN